MNSFTLYEEYYDLITILPDKKEQAELLLAICDYMFYGIEPHLNINQMKIFRNLKRPLDVAKKNSMIRNRKKPEENQTETKKEPEENQTKTKKEPNENQTETHQDVYVNVNSNSKNNRGMGEEEKITETEEQVIETEFSKLWRKYPNKVNEAHAKESYLIARRKGISYDTIANGLENYLRYLSTNNVAARYVKHGDNWFKDRGWENTYEVCYEVESVPDWHKKEAKKEEASIEEQQELEKLMNGLEDDNVG